LWASSIICDSLLFKSPTCTAEYVNAAKVLAEIGEVKSVAYAIAMLEACTDLGGERRKELLTMYGKDFTFGDSEVMIAQINAIDVENVYARKLELEAEINKIIEEKDLDLFLLVVTDIINSNSDVLALGKAANNVEKAFEVELLANRALLEG